MADLPLGLPKLTLKTPDKVIMAAVGVLVAGLVAWGLVVVLPTLIELAKDTLVFGLLCLAIAFLVLTFHPWSPIWPLLYYKWANLARNLRRAVAAEDPLGVLRTVITKYAAKLTDIDTHRVKADAALKRQLLAIREAERHAGEEEALAGAAARLGKPDQEIGVHAVKAKRWLATADEIRPMATFLEEMKEKMTAARDLCQGKLDDSQNQMETLTLKLGALREGQATVKSFKRFFGQNPDLEMASLAVEEIERSYTEAEAEIDEFMRQATPMIEAQNLKKAAEMQDALAKFQFPKQVTSGTPAAVVALPVREAVVVKGAQ